MRIAFLQQEWVDHYGIMCIATELKRRGHEVRVFIEKGHGRAFLPTVSRYRPDLVGFGCVTYRWPWVERTAATVKQLLRVPTIVGGVHPTTNPDVIESPWVDFTCRGEGELPMAELADALASGADFTRIENLSLKIDGNARHNPMRPLLTDLDAVAPDRGLYMDAYPFFRRFTWKNAMAGRGCPYLCTYCYNNVLWDQVKGKGKYVRWRSAANMVDEVVMLRDRYNARTIHFSDDTFALPHKWLYGFLEEYQRRAPGLPFICNARPDVLNEKMADALAAAGCYAVFFGLESGSEVLRAKVLNRPISDAQIVRTAALLHDRGIKFRANNMLGLPGETFEQGLETLALNVKIGTDFPTSYIFQPYPGLDLTQYAVEQGVLDENSASSAGHGRAFFGDNVLKKPDGHALVNLQQLFCLGVRLPWLIPLIKRLCRMRPNPLFFVAYVAMLFLNFIGAHRVSFIEGLYAAWHEFDFLKQSSEGDDAATPAQPQPGEMPVKA